MTTGPWTIQQLAPFRFIIARQRFPGKTRLALAAAIAAIRRQVPKEAAPTWEPLTFHGRLIYWDTQERAGDALDALRMARVNPLRAFCDDGPESAIWRFRQDDGLPTIETL